ncbi:unnamed protein product [Diatraea saccharalis]|uniref:Uncharacterized protein n=1 Tax=Diatraea saccharalis TaxID=40085 RepID=A0A9P0C824_9NEOP|nr:unnamed protein product [Diatraea saccharalis]
MATGSQPEERTALRQYYDDHGLLLSTEWILKILAIVGCLVSGAWLLGGGGCSGAGAGAGAGAWARAGAGAVLVCAGGAALVLAAVAARLPPRAPLAWLVIDITTLTVMGALLLLTVAAAAALCDARAVSDYLLTVRDC